MHWRSNVGDDIEHVVRVQRLGRSSNAMRHGYAMFSELYAQEAVGEVIVQPSEGDEEGKEGNHVGGEAKPGCGCIRPS